MLHDGMEGSVVCAAQKPLERGAVPRAAPFSFLYP